MTSALWEYGSDYHYISNFVGVPAVPWQNDCIFTLSGRTALLALLKHLEKVGKFMLDTNTVWFPAYTCNQVTRSLQHNHYRLKFWDGNPVDGWEWPLTETESGDIWVLHNYFGFDVPGRHLNATLREKGVMIIEDHSHDPLGELACESDADYAFASLRKSIPLPDGGNLWSPRNFSLPDQLAPAPTPSLRIAAMLGKAAYLEGKPFEKEHYREWFASAEDLLSDSHLVGQSEFSRSQFERFDTAAWQSARDYNLNWLRINFPRSSHYNLLGTAETAGTLGLILVCSSKDIRNILRKYLTESKIYTAVLWPLPEDLAESNFRRAIGFQERMLFLHADGRYTVEDLMYLCSQVRKIESML